MCCLAKLTALPFWLSNSHFDRQKVYGLSRNCCEAELSCCMQIYGCLILIVHLLILIVKTNMLNHGNNIPILIGCRGLKRAKTSRRVSIISVVSWREVYILLLFSICLWKKSPRTLFSSFGFASAWEMRPRTLFSIATLRKWGECILNR